MTRDANAPLPLCPSLVTALMDQALVQQRLFDWLGRFGSQFGIKCVEISGDSPGSSSLRDLAASQLVFTTPEKWDSISRAWNDHIFLLGTVRYGESSLYPQQSPICLQLSIFIMHLPTSPPISSIHSLGPSKRPSDAIFVPFQEAAPCLSPV